MQVQKGIVKYKDRSDIVCTYGVTDDGKQYYFLDGNVASNGNIVATTVLVEAIDPVVGSSSIGLIDPNGNVVIPFENKSIKVINDNILLVEKANSTTPSVVEANQLRSDPLAATKLVTTPATIKERINGKMSGEGRFVFNDQFSEATICDVNGNNLVNDEYYSFIAIKNDEIIYMSKNVVDSPVMEFSISNGVVVESANTENNILDSLDVSQTDVSQDTIEEAMSVNENSGFGSSDITAKDFEAISSLDEGDSLEENVVEEEKEEQVVEEDDASDTDIPDELVINTTEEVETATEEDSSLNVENEVTVEDAVSEVESEIPVVNADDEETVEETESVLENVVSDSEVTSSDELVAFDFGDNINYSSVVTNEVNEKEEDDSLEISDSLLDKNIDLFSNDISDDVFAESKLHVDKIINDSEMDYNFDYSIGSSKDTIIEDVASAMSNLINLNRNQKQKIMAYEEKVDEIASVHKRVVEKARSQARDIELLKSKIKNYETMVAKLEAKVQSLENKVYDQERLISNQSSELEALRPQIEGKKELVKILADAQVLLDQVA